MAIEFETVYDNDGNVIEVIEHNVPDTPDWPSFRRAFASNMLWLMYASSDAKVLMLASRLETLAMVGEPDAITINEMIQLMYTIAAPTTQTQQEWQAISDQYFVGVNFIKQ